MDYKKRRTQIRLNFMVAILLLGTASVLSITYGVVFFYQLYVANNFWLGFASFAGSFVLSILCSGFLVKIAKKLRLKLLENEANAPASVVTT